MSTLSLPVGKMIPVARPYIGIEEEQAVIESLRSGWITQGPRVAEFEEQFRSYIGAEHAVAVSSCTTGLHLAMLALGIGRGDEVICPSLSFIATANSIAYTGATPVFCDIDLATYNIDPEQIEQLITPRTRAILVVHQIGVSADMTRILAVARQYGILVIEDAACAIGSEYQGQIVGRPLGVMACFSFHPRKVLTTGEGGMITTNDSGIADRLRRLRQHAMSVSDVARHKATQILTERYDEIGYNFRMTDMQAAIGITQLARLAGFLAKRRHLAERYTQAIGDLEWLVAPNIPDGSRSNFQSYMVRMTGPAATLRDQLMQELLEQGISTRRAIMAIHREQPYSAERWNDSLPKTDLVTDTSLILPLFHDMTEGEQDYVVEALHRFQA